MTIRLFRVDERLIHGQVVVGWGRRLHPRTVIVVHDELAGSAGEQDLYRAGLPQGIAAEFWTEREAIARLPSVEASEEAAIVLTEDLDTMKRLVEGGVKIAEINVGGIHAAAGRRRVLPYVCLDEEDVGTIRALESRGVHVTAQDLPSTSPVRLVERAAG